MLAPGASRCACWRTGLRRLWQSSAVTGLCSGVPVAEIRDPPPQERKWDRAEGVRAAGATRDAPAPRAEDPITSVLVSSLIKCGSPRSPSSLQSPRQQAHRAGSGYVSSRAISHIPRLGRESVTSARASFTSGPSRSGTSHAPKVSANDADKISQFFWRISSLIPGHRVYPTGSTF